MEALSSTYTANTLTAYIDPDPLPSLDILVKAVITQSIGIYFQAHQVHLSPPGSATQQHAPHQTSTLEQGGES